MLEEQAAIVQRRQAPGIFSYMAFFSTKVLAYSLYFGVPFVIALLSMILNGWYFGEWDFIYFFEILFILTMITFIGTFFSIVFYHKKSPLLGFPPKGWAFQLNTFFTGLIGGSFLIGQILTLYFKELAFQEIFFILGTIVAYIMAFTLYFSFTTVGRPGYLILSLVQPVVGIILYSIYTAQTSLDFFLKAILFFCSCAFIFALPYARGLFQVSNVYREATGIGGYGFIRAFVLSMLTDGNDERIEGFFDKVGVQSSIKIQYLAIRSKNTKNVKGLFILPHAHFGPFKTCGSSDLPEHIYKTFSDIPGTTVYHTTTDHSQNLTTQNEVDKVLSRISQDIEEIKENKTIQWIQEVRNVSRKMSNTAKLIGTEIDNVPIVFLTRHPLPSDDIQAQVGDEIRTFAKSEGCKDIIIIDAHNSIIGDEIHILKDSLEAKDLIHVAENFVTDEKRKTLKKVAMSYGVAKDHLSDFTEKDGIGFGGMVVHLFMNSETEQKTALIHFDANNAFADIRSYILNMLQNRGIEMGEITTSDSHTVARQFTSRGYSPIGDKIKLHYILQKLDNLLLAAEKDLEPVEFLYKDSIEQDIRIWGDQKYFDAIIDTLQACIKKSQNLLTLSLIIPTFFSLVLLLFYYNIPLGDIIEG